MIFPSFRNGPLQRAIAWLLALSALHGVRAAEVDVSDRAAFIKALQQATPGTTIRVASASTTEASQRRA